MPKTLPNALDLTNKLSAGIQFWNLFNAKALMSHHTAFRHFLKDKGIPSGV